LLLFPEFSPVPQFELPGPAAAFFGFHRDRQIIGGFMNGFGAHPQINCQQKHRQYPGGRRNNQGRSDLSYELFLNSKVVFYMKPVSFQYPVFRFQ
jgi:hypothetical protein